MTDSGARSAGAVVAGVDSSSGSAAALALAAREAAYRGAPLIAVQAYAGELSGRSAHPPGTREADGERAEAQRRLRATACEALGAAADRAELRVVRGLAGRSIVDVARQCRAQLIVLAAHGSTSLLLGTVSQYVLRKAPCPVLIVPADQLMALSGA